MTFSTLLYQLEDGVATITLNRPELFNALNTDLLRELTEAFRVANQDPEVRVVVLTGSGKAFCSGQDLREASQLLKGQPKLEVEVRERYNPLIQQMYSMDKPTIAAVNGVAAGAGCSLALACDMRIVSSQTKFTLAFVRIGLVPDSGASFFLPRLVGVGRALELLTTGRDVSATEAVEIGMANQLVPASELESETLQLAKQLAKGPTKAIAMTRKMAYQSMESSLEQMLEQEAINQGESGRTRDFLEGVRSFAEKRLPDFQGK
ncbi:enoyl-CoA hydratase/isomerase family protein [Thermoactinomyces sp. DSM 45892]|uniref:enoyl-CoA hydratase/isomerase family protein n=1 Tax=Thermoactinomyces sp. DSM 45892 TaxID=1882753 RepID=UPI00089AA0B3|nr:enoyl-CoA hydratase-related protein [Thermoactinomyces sp. DSM 45892]SDZ36604.1 2-(1,2-epoxy-1,2-dihydrophenyl)acetyl-CoA isomerase [Thermoactinomyces sp. DSM 45892]